MTDVVGVDWARRAARSRRNRIGFTTGVIACLTLVSIPIIVPYLWLLVISLTDRAGGAEFHVLWRVLGIAGVAFALLIAIACRVRNETHGVRLRWMVGLMALLLLSLLVAPQLTLHNYRFLWNPDVQAAGARSDTLPSIWAALGNSFLFAAGHTLLVTLLAVPAAYALSRLGFRRREGVLKTLLLLHAFPVMALTVAIFIQIYWMGMLNSLLGVMLVMCALELPFAIFVMKGFFDGVSWNIEMSAITDGASRFQAFRLVVLPQVTGGVIAIATFAFLRGWEEYIFVRTLLIDSNRMTMSLYLFWTSQDSMGADSSLIAAVGVIYILPVIVLYLFTQKYLTQMSVGGIKG
ncbi:carbohydrate ABC transporter permease [Brenneria populi]|uniref:Maltose/maltodextrin transport system permease protein MalG n=1 Tax=Brenneria populi TaxID=1505588 RepID=A0ABU6JN31_9GAMM|nr:carbohydrate ABC transporter permease [Brenneria populi Li et al. 2015]